MKRDDSETIVIAGALADPKLAQICLERGLEPEDFHDSKSNTVWSYFIRADKNGDALNCEAMAALAKQDGISDIAEFYIKAASKWPGNTELHEKALNNFLISSKKRRAGTLARIAIEDCLAEDDEKSIRKASDLLHKAAVIAGEQKLSRIKTSAEVAASVSAKIDKPVRRLQTGIAKLDQVLGGGLDLGRVISIIGKYKVGKTTLLSTIGFNVAYGAGEKDKDNTGKVLFVTLERNQTDVEMLNMSRSLEINMGDLERKAKSLEKKIEKYISDPIRDSILYYHRPRANLDEIVNVIYEAVKKHNVELVMIDYYQIIGRPPGSKLLDHLMDVDQTINAVAADLNIAIVIAAQSDADGNPRDCKTLLNSASANFVIRRQENNPDAWLENLASNYRKQRDAGSPSNAAMMLNEEKGPHFSSL